MFQYRVSPKGRQDIKNLEKNYARISKKLRQDFKDCFLLTIIQIRESPEAFAHYCDQNDATTQYRKRRVKDFNKIIIFYRIKHNEIVIMRILHGARNLPEMLG